MKVYKATPFVKWAGGNSPNGEASVIGRSSTD